MFENTIDSTPFTGTLADCMFRHINGNNFDSDVSFLATLRALLMQRMSAEDTVDFHYCALQSQTNEVSELNALVRRASNGGNNFIVVNYITDPFEDNDDAQKDLFTAIEAPEGYCELADVQVFFAEKMLCRAFINETTRSVIFMVFQLTPRKYHLIQCSIPKLMPWFFADNHISMQERDLLFSLRYKTSAEYEEALTKMSQTTTYKQKSSSAMIIAFKRKSLEKQKRTAEQMITQINQKIDRLNRDILLYFRNLNDENFKLNGILAALQSAETDTSDDFAQFITNNACIDILNYTDDVIRFAVRGYLDVYDPEAYQSLANNRNSWYWDCASNETFVNRTSRKMLLDAIFGDNPTFKLKTVGVFSLNVTTAEVSAYRNESDYRPYMSTHHPNPHLYYNACLGAHRAPISRALVRGDIIGAMSQCISSAHSVNVTESASFRYTCRNLFNDDKAVLEGPDGQLYTPAMALQYLQEQEANNSN